MRLYELVPVEVNRCAHDVVVHNDETNHTVVLTPQGAVYNTENTTDLRNICIAFGVLTTSDAWRVATQEEIEELRLHPPTAMLELNWAIPQPKPRPVLTIVKGVKIYDDDDTQ